MYLLGIAGKVSYFESCLADTSMIKYVVNIAIERYRISDQNTKWYRLFRDAKLLPFRVGDGLADICESLPSVIFPL